MVRVAGIRLTLGVAVLAAALAAAAAPAASAAVDPVLLARLNLHRGAAAASYGKAVAVSGTTTVVGDDGAGGKGAVYVYEDDGGTPALVATLHAPAPQQGDLFGHSVAVDGGTIVVGAPGAIPQSDFGGSGRQRAYVFERSAAGRWRRAATLTRSAAPATGAVFGWAVAVSGGTVAVAAIDPLGAGVIGEADVFARPDGGWRDMTQTARLVPAGAVADDQVGASIAVSGATVVVGAPRVAVGGAMVGAAYVFTRPRAGWADATGGVQLPLAAGSDLDGFGDAVAVHGGTVAVGAPGGAWWGHHRPYVALYRRPAAGWSALTRESARFDAPDGQLIFGASVALAPGVLVVGARAKGGSAQAGRVYVYGEGADGWSGSADPAVIAPPRAAGSTGAFGVVAADGSRFAVGKTGDSSKGQGGSAYVYGIAGLVQGRARIDHHSTLRVRIRVPGAGLLVVRGTAGWGPAGRDLCRSSARADAAGWVEVECTPNVSLAQRARGRVKMTLHLSFVDPPQAPVADAERFALLLPVPAPVTG